MFGRRKKPDGFEWHKYIRTTIKLRREQRRERILQARRSAAEQAGAAGVALAQGSRAAGVALAQGSLAAGAAARDCAVAGLGVAGLAAQAMWNVMAAVSALAWQRLTLLARPLIAALARPNIGGPVALAGAIALGSGIGRYRGAGLDAEALITLGIGVVLLIAALPMLSSLTGMRMPRLPSLAALGISPRTGLAAVAIAALLGGLAWIAAGSRTDLAGTGSQLPLIGGAKPLQGRAEALSGDRVRVAGTTVRLAGIEAPERQQTCGTGSRRQRCGAAARAALARLVSGRSLSCTLSGIDAAGRPLASCTRGKLDINGELVRQGHVFAEGGLFASYTGLEREARAAKAGIWAGGEAERPSEYRAKVWEEAKRRAPDGCPIKGLVTGGARVYVLPWSPDYERGRIQKARGERWFCSEQEAVAAGWKPAVRG
jgi:endonuclease YncB( thermonuclease family)